MFKNLTYFWLSTERVHAKDFIYVDFKNRQKLIHVGKNQDSRYSGGGGWESSDWKKGRPKGLMEMSNFLCIDEEQAAYTSLFYW